MIRDVRKEDVVAICTIYNYYIVSTTITFEETPVTQSEMSNRIDDITSNLPWVVYEYEGKVIGYAYASKWKTRSAYRYSAELSVYIDVNSKGKGIGTKLYTNLIEKLKELGYHSIIGGIALPNNESVRLHEKFGFKNVANFVQIGFKHNTWLDVGYWQLLLS